MIIHHVVDEIFRSWSHVAVLRVLLDTAEGMTGNQTARAAGMHPRSALKSLSVLEELGIVNRRRGGRDHSFTLNREHVLVRDIILPLYRVEREFPININAAISRLLKKHVVGAVIFGSVVRNNETALSDFDVCCIVKNEKSKDHIRKIWHDNSQKLYKRFGIRVSPIIVTVEEIRRKSTKPLIREVVEQGETITGISPKELLND
jgi:predicted nucleotidyltransferase